MSLLGIIIDKTKAKERLDSPKGFVAGSTDEQLLKEIGAIVLEKGVWTPRHKGSEVAEFLNWIAEGKPKGPLPSLAKRLLCLKREKLARGIKDAGTADYARTFEKKWIAEIDAIFSDAGENVECVVDFLKPNAECPPSVPPSVSPSAPPSVSPSAPPSVSPSAPPSAPPSVPPSVQPSAPPSVQPSAPPSLSPSVPPSAPPSVPPSVPPSAPPSVPPSVPPASRNINANVRNASNNDTTSNVEEKVVIKTPFDKLEELLIQKYEESDSLTKPRLERIIGGLSVKRTSANINEIVDAINNILAKDVIMDEKITEINIILGIIEKSINADSTLEEVKKLVHDVTLAKKTYYPEIKHLLKELIYTTCGEASLLDPLVDHLHNLIATFQTISNSNSRFSGIKSTLEELRAMLMKEALSMETTQKSGALKARLEQLQNNLTTLTTDTFLDNSLPIDTRNQIASLREQIKSLEALIESSESVEAQKEIKRIELTAEKDLLLQLISIAGDKYDKIGAQAKGFIITIDAEIRALDSATPNIKSISTECNKRAFEYRMFLESLKTDESADHARDLAQMETKRIGELDALRTEKDALIGSLRTQLENDTLTKDGRINNLTSQLANTTATIERLQSSNEEKESRIHGANAAKNASNAKLITARAQIAALQAALLEAKKLSSDIAERNERIDKIERESDLLANGTRTNADKLRDLALTLNDERKGRAANIAARNSRIVELEGDLATRKDLRNALNTSAAAERGALEANVTGLRTQIEKISSRLAGAETDLATQKDAAKTASNAAARTKEALIADVTRLTDDLAAAHRRGESIESLTTQLKEAHERHDSNSRSISELREQTSRIADLEKELVKARVSVEGLGTATTRIKELEGELSSARNTVGNSERRREALEAELAAGRAARNTAVARLSEDSVTIEELRKQLEDEKAIVDDLVAKLAEERSKKPTTEKFPPRGYSTGVKERAAAIDASGRGTDPSLYATSHRGHGSVYDPTRPAVAEATHLKRVAAGRTTGTPVGVESVVGAAKRGGTRKYKKKTNRHTRKLRK